MPLTALLISNGFQPNYEKAFANGLAANGICVTLIASDRTLTDQLVNGVLTCNLRGSQDHNRSRWEKAMNLLRYAQKLVTHLRKEKYDVVHLTGMFMTPSVLAGCIEWIAYRLQCRKFVMTVHNILPHGRDGLWYRINYHLIYRLAHLLVVHTNKMRAELIDGFGIDPARVVVMMHGVDEVPPVTTVPVPCERLRVLLFGGLSHYKGVDQFLRAARECPDVAMHIVIAGEARDARYAKLVSGLIEALPPEHQVEWHRGFIAEEKVKDYFEGTDVVVLPYRNIDQSGVLFTALRFGAPLIATDVGSFTETMPAYSGVVAASAEPRELAAACRRFVERRAEFDRALIREYAKSLSWPNTVRPLILAYKETCA